MEEEKKVEFYGSNYMSLIPLLVFVVFCVLCFVIFKDFAMESVCMGGFLSLIIGSLFAKNNAKYWDAVVKGMSSEMMNTLALILFVVSMFGRMMTRAGVAEGFVWLGHSLGLQGGLFTVFTFIATCIMSTATGTSIGTLFSAFPILYPSGVLLGSDPILLAGAILSGAIFGDNVAPISDTTIASASSQTFMYKKGAADIGGVVKTRMKYALVAALLAIICFLIFGGSSASSAGAEELLDSYSDPKGLIMLLPVIFLLIVAVRSQNIFLASTVGIISGIVIGLPSGILAPADILGVENGALSGFFIDGIKNIIGTVGYLYAVAGVIGVLNESGTMEKIIQKLVSSKLNQSAVGSEIIMALGIMITSICLGSANGPAIIMFGPIADKIGKSHDIHPYRRANLLDVLDSDFVKYTSNPVFSSGSAESFKKCDSKQWSVISGQ